MPVLPFAAFALSAVQGFSAMNTQNQMARQYDEQGRTLRFESEREAFRIEDDAKRFAEEQKLMYIGSGVEIGGSAVVTLAQTDSWARAEADATRARGRSLQAYQSQSARIARNQGRAAFIGGVVSGIGSAYAMRAHTAAPGSMGTKSVSADDAWYARSQNRNAMPRF